MAKQRDKFGGWHLTKKGYPRYHSGQYRNQYVHRVWAAKYRRRKLDKDEDVHHNNGNKLDWSRKNLKVLGHKEHGWVSAKQHYAMKENLVVEKAQWDAYFEDDVGFP